MRVLIGDWVQASVLGGRSKECRVACFVPGSPQTGIVHYDIIAKLRHEGLTRTMAKQIYMNRFIS